MRKLTIPALVIVSLSFAVACGKSGEKGDDGKGGDDKKAKITLEKKAVPEMGVELLIPKGAKTLQKGKMASTFSLPLPGGMHEINVHITGAAHKNMKGLVRMATMMGGKKVLEKKKIDGGFFLVKKARGPLTEVWVAKTKGDKGVTVKVSVKDEHKGIAVKIGKSLVLK
jgi:hypothetical protein